MICPDHVVVGAGPAGCVAARRLADSGARVLLVEAGGAVTREPGDGTRLYLEGRNWPHAVNLRTAADRERTPRARWAAFPYPVGRALGGSSAVNGCLAVRAPSADFDRWSRRGLPGWTGTSMAPWQDRVEQWWPRSTGIPEHLHPVDAQFAQSCRRRGVPEVDLSGGPGTCGVGLIATSTHAGSRLDPATLLLDEMPPNLSVLTGAQVHRVRLRHSRVTGLELVDRGRLATIETGSVLLAAGALGTPALLQHSGIGALDELQAAGVRPQVELPGVGHDLHDHVSVVVWAQTRHFARAIERWREIGAQLATGDSTDPEVLIGPVHDVGVEAIPALRDRAPQGLVGMSCMLMHPRSRGRLTLTGSEPAVLPQADLALLEDPADLDRMTDGVHLAWELLHDTLGGDLVQVQSWSERVVRSGQARRRATRELAVPAWHAVGSARMGDAGDPGSVVDSTGRVHGVAGLRVVDAAVHPQVVGVPTALTTAAVAERLTAELLQPHQTPTSHQERRS